MYCSNCGKEISVSDKFCSYCGSPVQQPVQQTMQQQPMQQNQQGQYQQPVWGQQNNQQINWGEQTSQQQVNWQQPSNYVNRGYQNAPQQMPFQTFYNMPQKDTFYVRKLPMVLIVFLTLTFFVSSWFMNGSSLLIATIFPMIQGIILLTLIYKLDKIEPEPIGLLVTLFVAGGIFVVIAAIIMELALEFVIGLMVPQGTVLFAILNAFVVAAFSEEICKYAALKKLTWRHPAFNYRFDGVVYATTVAMGFEFIENLEYMLMSTIGTAFVRSAFPGHCIFGIYMGYYYGQAKSLELRGDIVGSAKMRRKGVLIAILIHGTYDAICMIPAASDNIWIMLLFMIALAAIMCVLNVKAYKNIKVFSHEDKPV